VKALQLTEYGDQLYEVAASERVRRVQPPRTDGTRYAMQVN